MPAGNTVQVVLSMNADTYSAAITKAQKQLDQFKGKSEEAGKSVGQSMQKSREGVMMLGEEIGIRLPRGLRNFVTELPGVATAMNAAFDAIAVIALISVVVEAGRKIAEFISKSEEAGKAQTKAWTDSLAALKMTVEEQTVSNDKLQDQVDKLEHKPRNALKDAIDEAIVSAGKLGDKLTEDIKKISDGIKEENVWQRMGVLGPGDSPVKGELENYQARIAQITEETQANVANAKSIRDKTAAQKAGDEAYIRAGNDSKGRLGALVTANTTTTKDSTDGFGVTVPGKTNHNYALEAAATAGSRTIDLNNALTKGDAGSLDNQDYIAAHSGDKNAKEEADKASKAALDKDQATLDARYLDPSKDADKIAAYWMAIVQATAKGSVEYKGAMEHLVAANKEQWKALHDLVNKETQDPLPLPKMAELNNFLPKDLNKKLDDLSLELSDKAALATIKAKNEMDNYTNSLKVATGAMSEQQAASQRMSNDALENAAQLKVLKDALVKLKAEGTYNPITGQNMDEANARQQGEVQSQIGSTTSEGQLKATQDAQAHYLTTAVGGVSTALNEFAAKVTNVGQVLGQFVMQSLSDVNNAILNPGKPGSHRFKAMGLAMGKDAEGSALKGGEGMAIKGVDKLLHLGGKKDGSSKANALWTQSADLGVGSSTGSASGVAEASDSGGFLSGLISKMSFAAPLMGFATGGNAQAGTMAMVGEHGPELAYFGSDAHITPNQSLHSAVGGGGGGDTYNIDARQTSNPAQTAAYIQAAIDHSRQQAVQQSVAATRDIAKRKP
jgi:predicted transcriptional regulator